MRGNDMTLFSQGCTLGGHGNKPKSIQYYIIFIPTLKYYIGKFRLKKLE